MKEKMVNIKGHTSLIQGLNIFNYSRSLGRANLKSFKNKEK